MSELHQFVVGDKVTLSAEVLLGCYSDAPWISGAVGLVGFVTSIRQNQSGKVSDQSISVDWVDAEEDLEWYSYHNSWLKYLGSTTE